MGLQTMWTLHTRKNCHYLLCQSSVGGVCVWLECGKWVWLVMAYIFCPMVEFSWKSRSTSTSKLASCRHQVIPPTICSKVWSCHYSLNEKEEQEKKSDLPGFCIPLGQTQSDRPAIFSQSYAMMMSLFCPLYLGILLGRVYVTVGTAMCPVSIILMCISTH